MTTEEMTTEEMTTEGLTTEEMNNLIEIAQSIARVYAKGELSQEFDDTNKWLLEIGYYQFIGLLALPMIMDDLKLPYCVPAEVFAMFEELEEELKDAE